MFSNNSTKLKYNTILTRKFLEKEYLVNKKSIFFLSKELKIDWNTIKNYIQLHKILLRSHKEQASISSPGGKYKYANLLTKKFLTKEYLKEGKGILNLAKELKLDQGTIRRYLKKHNIKTKGIKEQLNINFPPKEFKITSEIESFIDGLLLGDASIPKRKDGIAPRCLTQACKYKEYLEYIQKRFNNFNINSSPILSRWIKDVRCKNKGYVQHFLQTRRYKTFEIFRERWYPKGVKIIPKDFIITKDLLLQLYLCDGNFYREIRLCIDAFTKRDSQFLKKLVENELDIKLRIKRVNGSGLFIKKSDSKKFLNYIGKFPVGCYEYKWQDNESEEAKERKRLKAKEKYYRSKNACFCGTLS